MRDTLEVDCLSEHGYPAYDRLTFGQRLTVLCEVAAGLLDPSVPPPPLTAANECAIAVLYSHLDVMIEEVSESSEVSDSRRLIVRACQELGLEDAELDRSCRDAEPDSIWRALELLRDRILWDADYADEDLFLDLGPQEAAALHGLARTSGDYYLHIPPDPSEGEIESLIRRLDSFILK
ncbi:MAG: hypothetical protein U0625_04465 [Phycisphaerales bacterium]